MSGSAAVWIRAIRAAVRCLRSDPVLGLRRLILPVSYWRTAEFAYVWRQLDLPTPARILDVGSPKELAAWFARWRGHAVTSVDILHSEIEYSARHARAQGVHGMGPGRVDQAVQDARGLTFDDASFDAAYSVSVLEHIPDAGDTLALREMVRVVRPGGLIVLTVPFADAYFETFVSSAVYERSYRGQPVFYERHYDHVTLAQRLTDTPGTRLTSLELCGERVPVERLLGWNGGLRAALSPLEPLLAIASLHIVPPSARAKAAFVTLERTT